MDKKAYDQ